MLIVIALLGLTFGSFVGAQVWRVRAKQLEEDKALREPYDKKEYKVLSKLLNKDQKDDRSLCLHCGHQLRWYDLLPLASWISTKGRCRYCKKSIGSYEPMVEISTAFVFCISFIFWPIELSSWNITAQFVVWLIVCLYLIFLFIYDLKWYLLPDKVVYSTIIGSVIFFILGVTVDGAFTVSRLIDLVASLSILSGIYYALWKISSGRWIGFGDVKLGIALAFLVGSWQLAFLTLFTANLIGCLIVIPGLISKKMTRSTQIPFGPMLIAATILVVIFGESVVASYISVTSTMLML